MAKEPILQVLSSFQATIDGELVSFRPGELIDSDHPAVKTWPQYFGPVQVHHRAKAEPIVEQATARPGEKRGR